MNLRIIVSAFLITLISMPTVHADNEGLEKLDKATDLKLDANSPRDLERVVQLCEEAIEEGLDEANEKLANKILAASAFQRAKALWQRLPNVAGNPQNVRELRKICSADLEKAVAAKPDLADAWILLAQIEAMDRRNIEKAVGHIDNAVKHLADRPVDLANAYILRAAMQDTDEERLADLQKAIEADSTNQTAWQGRISLQMRMGNLQEAVDEAEKLLENDADNDFALRAAVDSLIQLKKIPEAIELTTKKIEASPDNGFLYRERAKAYRRRSFEEDLEETLQIESRDAAFDDLNKAIELDSRDFQALAMRGEIHFEKEEFEKANRDISDSLLIEPNSIQGVLFRALIAGAQERYSDAIADMKTLVRFDPNNGPWIRQLAQYYHVDDRPREAIRLLDALLKSDETDWEAIRLRGDARLSISEHVSAIGDYDQALPIVKGLMESSEEGSEERKRTKIAYSGLLNNLAWVLATSPKDEIRDGERSVELGLRACELTDYKAAHILSTLAAGYAEIGDFENARKWSQKSVDEGAMDDNPEQQEQLLKELESYKADKPWREEQETEENAQPINSASETIDT